MRPLPPLIACILALLSGAAATAQAQTGAGAQAQTGAGAQAQTGARLQAAFQPYRLGHRSTLQFRFAFSAPPGQVPPPLISMQLRYPRGINFYLNNLGIRRCAPAALEAQGPRGCPRNSVMGYGVVTTGVVLGDTEVQENAPITILRAPERDGHLALLFYAEGTHPVVTNVLFSGLLLSASEPFGGRVQIGVPLVETLPGAPFVSVIQLHATIGPEHLTYYHTEGGVSLAFRPQGILLPPTCSGQGFPFAASFAFSNGTRALARTTVRCPAGPRTVSGRGHPGGGRGRRRRPPQRPGRPRRRGRAPASPSTRG